MSDTDRDGQHDPQRSIRARTLSVSAVRPIGGIIGSSAPTMLLSMKFATQLKPFRRRSGIPISAIIVRHACRGIAKTLLPPALADLRGRPDHFGVKPDR